MHRQKQPFNNHSLNRGSWAVMLLALAYIASAIFLVSRVYQQPSDGWAFKLIIVISTLLIAALFAPLRRRVQAFIDHRFYRRKYDAQKILAQFAQKARDEMEIEVLATELHRVIRETMQPETIEVSLKEQRL